MSVKFIDILTGQVEIKSEFQNLTFTREDYNANVKYPLFYINTSDIDPLYPFVVENASEFLEIMDGLRDEIQSEYESLVTLWYADPANTNETIEDHELDEADFLKIKEDAITPDRADVFLGSLAASGLEKKFEVYTKLQCIYKYYYGKPFAICFHPKAFHLVLDSEEANDKELINKIYEEKNIKFIVNLTDAGAVSFTKADAFVKEQNMLYLAVDRDFGDENVAKPATMGKAYAKNTVTQEAFDIDGPLSNFLPNFDLKNSCGVANTSFDPEAISVLAEKDVELAVKVFNLEEETETIRLGLSVKDIALPIVSDELYNKYNGLTANTVFDYIDLPFKPTFYLKGQGTFRDDQADDYKCVNMTSLVDKDGFVSHMVMKNEEDYYGKEFNIKAGTEKSLEELFIILKKLADQGKIKKSKLGEISFVINNYMRKLVDDKTVDNFIIRKLAFEDILDETTGLTEEKLVVEAVGYFSVGFTKVEIFNKYVF